MVRSRVDVLHVTSAENDLADPLHCAMRAAGPGVVLRSGAHRAHGGREHGHRPRLVNVDVTGDWDARGTLGFPNTPIGMRNIRCSTTVTVAGDERGERADRLLRSAEKYCVILNTLRDGVSVESSFELHQAPETA